MDQSLNNQVTSRGKIVEIQERKFEKPSGEVVKYFVLVLMHTFTDYNTNKTEEKLHVTHVSKPSLFDRVAELAVDDEVEIVSRVESYRNNNDRSLYFHKIKALRIDVLNKAA
jgi:hypothetical protein